MVQEIKPGLYRIEIPLPNNPLRALNSYVFKAEERNLIVDTGFDREECYEALHNGLRELEIDLNKTDFFITHLHADHSGLVHRLVTPSSKVYASEHDGQAILAAAVSNNYWDQVREYAGRCGFPKEELEKAIFRHPGYKYGNKKKITFTYVSDGDIIKVGDYTLTCVAVPGHTQGLMCLYEKEKKILLSGDHILGEITPNISLWSDDFNPLAQYLDSLDKVYQLDITLTLPSHRQILGDCKPRIAELKKHHAERLAEVEKILANNGELNAYQVASKMTWDMTYDSFFDFPTPQKWFALGEAIAHLKYLADNGSIRQIIQGDQIYYRKDN